MRKAVYADSQFDQMNSHKSNIVDRLRPDQR
jgi:hypothetical protein